MRAKRLSIYVPAEVLEELEAYKAFINVSAVCTSALKAELDRLRVLDKELGEDVRDASPDSVLKYVAARLGGR